MKKLLQKLINRETLTYLIFGVLTTLVNYVVFWLFDRLLTEHWVLVTNAIAFVAAVAFAYVTNKLFVFESKSWAPKVVWKELIMFVAARLFSFGLEELGLLLARDVFHAASYTLLGIGGLMIAKILLSVLTVVLNYFFSKFMVFTKK